jgi:hypothetical protein
VNFAAASCARLHLSCLWPGVTVDKGSRGGFDMRPQSEPLDLSQAVLPPTPGYVSPVVPSPQRFASFPLNGPVSPPIQTPSHPAIERLPMARHPSMSAPAPLLQPLAHPSHPPPPHLMQEHSQPIMLAPLRKPGFAGIPETFFAQPTFCDVPYNMMDTLDSTTLDLMNMQGATSIPNIAPYLEAGGYLPPMASPAPFPMDVGSAPAHDVPKQELPLQRTGEDREAETQLIEHFLKDLSAWTVMRDQGVNNYYANVCFLLSESRMLMKSTARSSPNHYRIRRSLTHYWHYQLCTSPRAQRTTRTDAMPCSAS